MEYGYWNSMCEPFCLHCDDTSASNADVTKCHISYKPVTMANFLLQTLLLARFSKNKCSMLIILLLEGIFM